MNQEALIEAMCDRVANKCLLISYVKIARACYSFGDFKSASFLVELSELLLAEMEKNK